MKIKLLLSVLALVFTVQSFGNDMLADLRVNLQNGIALDPASARVTLRKFYELGAPTAAVVGAVKNENARLALMKIRDEITTMTPYEAQGLLREALMETSENREINAAEIADQLIASTAAYMMMWDTFSRWMVSNAEMICPASYNDQECQLFKLN